MFFRPLVGDKTQVFNLNEYSTSGPLPPQIKSGWEACSGVENLAYLVTCQARHRWFWPTSRSRTRGKVRRRRRHRRKRGLVVGGLC